MVCLFGKTDMSVYFSLISFYLIVFLTFEEKRRKFTLDLNLIDRRPKKIILLFSEMWVAKKIFTRAAVKIFFLLI